MFNHIENAAQNNAGRTITLRMRHRTMPDGKLCQECDAPLSPMAVAGMWKRTFESNGRGWHAGGAPLSLMAVAGMREAHP